MQEERFNGEAARGSPRRSVGKRSVAERGQQAGRPGGTVTVTVPLLSWREGKGRRGERAVGVKSGNGVLMGWCLVFKLDARVRRRG